MPSFDVKVKVTGAQEVQVLLNSVKQRMATLSTPLKASRLLMLRSIDNNFKSSGRPITWKPLALSTLRWKMKHGYSSKPLIRKGLLIKSIVGKIQGDNKLIMGTVVPYAKYHQFGTRSIPKRPFLLFQDQDIQNINSLITGYIKDGKI